MKRYGLPKRQKLCSETAIDMLFSPTAAGVEAALCYPLRGVWRVNEGRRDGEDALRFLISVPKRRLRRAVDRVKMRRRVREAFRLNQHAYPSLSSRSIDFGIIYVADRLLPYPNVERAINRLMMKMSAEPEKDTASSCEP